MQERRLDNDGKLGQRASGRRCRGGKAGDLKKSSPGVSGRKHGNVSYPGGQTAGEAALSSMVGGDIGNVNVIRRWTGKTEGARESPKGAKRRWLRNGFCPRVGARPSEHPQRRARRGIGHGEGALVHKEMFMSARKRTVPGA